MFLARLTGQGVTKRTTIVPGETCTQLNYQTKQKTRTPRQIKIKN